MQTLAGLWRKTSVGKMNEKKVFSLPALSLPEEDSDSEEEGNKPTSVFKQQFNKTQKKLEQIAAMDDLLSGIIALQDTKLQYLYLCMTYLLGMLSKSLGQIIRVSAAMHVLFHLESKETVPDIISDAAIEAAIDFVEVCCQHTAYITGRGNINQELEYLQSGNSLIRK